MNQTNHINHQHFLLHNRSFIDVVKNGVQRDFQKIYFCIISMFHVAPIFEWVLQLFWWIMGIEYLSKYIPSLVSWMPGNLTIQKTITLSGAQRNDRLSKLFQ